jgi:hypothetical protein
MPVAATCVRRISRACNHPSVMPDLHPLAGQDVHRFHDNIEYCKIIILSCGKNVSSSVLRSLHDLNLSPPRLSPYRASPQIFPSLISPYRPSLIFTNLAQLR